MSTTTKSDLDPWIRQLDRTVDSYQNRMVQTRRHLHAHPEVSGEEMETTRYVQEQLQSDGFRVRTGPTGRGLIAESAGNGSGPKIAIRADLDALPIQDAKSVDYRSNVRGVMHACGHDAHTATVLGASLALASAVKSGVLPWPVSWRAIFQPAEETNQGALEMIEAGALNGVGGMLALHVDPSRPAGYIGERSGVLTACRTSDSPAWAATISHIISSAFQAVFFVLDVRLPRRLAQACTRRISTSTNARWLSAQRFWRARLCVGRNRKHTTVRPPNEPDGVQPQPETYGRRGNRTGAGGQ